MAATRSSCVRTLALLALRLPQDHWGTLRLPPRSIKSERQGSPVAYSVMSPTRSPIITQRPLLISFLRVQPNTLRQAGALRRRVRQQKRPALAAWPCSHSHM